MIHKMSTSFPIRFPYEKDNFNYMTEKSIIQRKSFDRNRQNNESSANKLHLIKRAIVSDTSARFLTNGSL